MFFSTVFQLNLTDVTIARGTNFASHNNRFHERLIASNHREKRRTEGKTD